MSINNPYLGPEQLPDVIPVFPLVGSLAAAARAAAAQYFRAALSRDDRRRVEDASDYRPDPAGEAEAAESHGSGASFRWLRRTDHTIRRDRRRPLPHHAHRNCPLSHCRGNHRADALSPVPASNSPPFMRISRRGPAKRPSIATACSAPCANSPTPTICKLTGKAFARPRTKRSSMRSRC